MSTANMNTMRVKPSPLIDGEHYENISLSLSRDEITRRNQHESPLLRLPGEVRNRIYEYVFGIDWIRVCHTEEIFHCTLLCSRCWDRVFFCRERVLPNGLFHYPRKLLAITKTCRQIHAEAKGLPLAINGIRGSPRALHEVFQHGYISKHLHEITSISLVFDGRSIRHERWPTVLHPPERHLVKLLHTISYFTGLKTLKLEMFDTWENKFFVKESLHLERVLLNLIPSLRFPSSNKTTLQVSGYPTQHVGPFVHTFTKQANDGWFRLDAME